MKLASLLILATTCQFSVQDCPEQVSDKGYNVIWRQSPSASNVTSEPLCYHDDILVRRTCDGTSWKPSLDELNFCQPTSKTLDVTPCPPGYHTISENNFDYCFQLGKPGVWDYPCVKSGGATVITDLSMNDIEYLAQSLESRNISKYFWLPAHRPKIFNPIVWSIPGPHWKRPLRESSTYNIYTSITKNCLLLDIERHIIVTETCSHLYPSLCFYVNEMIYPAKCPNGYHTFRYMQDEGACFGIEQSDNEYGSSFDDFLQKKCNKPMGDREQKEVARFLFKKIAESHNLPHNAWCWFETNKSNKNKHTNQSIASTLSSEMFEGVINNRGTLALMNKKAGLSCMACESEVIYLESELVIEYNANDEKIYLTVYYPSGLWKYNNDDIGIQCLTNAKGFNQVIDVNKIPLTDVTVKVNTSISNVEKTMYELNLVTNRSGQYWCEAHSRNFTLIKTNKILVNPNGNNAHVFSLVMQNYFSDNQKIQDYINNITTIVTDILDVEKVLLMDILEYTSDYIMVLLHLHTDISDIYDHDNKNLLITYARLKNRAQHSFYQHNLTFVNMSSSIYCLPTTSNDSFTLNWELTPIKHIAAPKQFCLQANGLPVKRTCHGSYLLGGYWGNVEGTCDKNYTPSLTTSYLYKFVKGDVSQNSTSRFLIDGLNFVLNDVDSLIPADIFYLSMSLQHFIYIAQDNDTNVDMGDMENIAWVMDRIMDLDCSYLRLAQTLNSTNVILDSINAIIEKLAHKDRYSMTRNNFHANYYEIAIQPQFIVQISYPEYNNITGIALSKNFETDKLSEMMMQPLYKNTTLEEVLSIPGLEIATWLPDMVLNSIRKSINDTIPPKMDEIYIVINIFNKDVVFQELIDEDSISHVINSRIVGVSLPGFMSTLQYPIPLVFRKFKKRVQNSYCGYWDFQSNFSENKLGIWSKTGCFLVKSIDNITVCECYHLTHFGQLLKIRSKLKDDYNGTLAIHTKVLNVISLVGSFLSLIGIIIIWITALLFKSWRKKAGTKVLLQLTSAIALPLLIITVFTLDENIITNDKGNFIVVSQNMKYVCILLGSLLHYSILSSFMWMLITAILQFVRYVRVLGVCRPARFMVKFALIGWGTPLFPVAVVLILDADNYLPNTQTNSGICYPSGYYMYFGLIAPICLILVVNVVLFMLVMNAISRGPDGKLRVSDAELIGAQLRLSILLFFLLGLTWVFGIFSFSRYLIWSYLFCLTSTLQGFVLFIYFVVCDPHTRSLWITLMKPQFDSRSRNSVVSISSG